MTRSHPADARARRVRILGKVSRPGAIAPSVLRRPTLRAADAHAIEEHDIFRTLVERSLAGIYLVQNERFVYVNPRFAELFGIPAESIVGRRVAQLVAPSDRARVLRNIRRRVDGTLRSLHYEFLGLRADGSTIPVEVLGSRVEFEGAPAVVGTLLDVSDRRRAEQERRRAERAKLEAKAERAVRARDEALGRVSHDLRNPLHTIRIGASLMLERADDRRASSRGALELIGRAAEQMNRIIDDLLDVSVIETGNFSLQREPHDTADIVERARALLEPLAAERSVSLEAEVEPGLPAVRVDLQQLLRVFSNVVGNAIKFTPAGGRVRLHAGLRGDDEICFTVRDSGPGIPEDQLPHVFARYWQAHRGDRRGAGLGLAISRAIVEAHGGRIWAEARGEEGATFCFSLPAHPG